MRALQIAVGVTAVLCSASAFALTPEERGLQIATEADAANTGFVGETSLMEMLLINAQGDTVSRRMESKVREKKGGDQSVITFRWPADVNGTRMLTWTHATKADDQWLYMPALKRVKRISARRRSGAFMASEFAYEDLGSQELEKYTYKFLRDEELDGRKAWVIERYPTDKKSGYTKQVVWMDQEYQNAVKIDFYDRKGELLKTMTLSEFNKRDRFWRADKIAVFNHQTRKRSELLWRDRKLGVKHDDADFDSENLDED